MKQEKNAKIGRWKAGLLAALMCVGVTVAYAQQVKGTVLDENGEPIIGANVVEKGTTNGMVTDLDGHYTLSVSNVEHAVLQFSYIGYNTKEEAVKGRSTIDVTMQPSVVNLGEVVAIGYGTQTRRQITGSVANVTEDNFNKGLTRDATDLLQGKVAGLMINSGSGDVTSTSRMRLRGVTTLQEDMGPLVVIDGIPGGDLSTVAPTDIESISVLKDATSAAIYGSRAAGGVILITTKKGVGNQTTVNYDGYMSVDVLANKPNLLNADQWRAYAAYSKQDPSVYDQYGADTDWFSELTRTGLSQNHSLSLSGGTSKGNYRISYTYQDRNGVMRDNKQERHSFRFQVQQRAINDRLRVGLTGSGTITDQQLPEAGNYILAYSMLPVYPVYNADGTYFTKVNAEFDQGNPVQNQDLNRKDNEMLYFYGSGDIQFELAKGLNTKLNLYKSRFSDTHSEFNNSTTEDGQSDQGNAEKRNRVWNRNLLEWTIDYERAFGADEEHQIQALAGYSWEENAYAYFFAQNRNFLSNDLSYNSLQSGNGLKTGDVESGKSAYKLVSLYARAFYGYYNRYMITAMLRRDGSSKFGKNNKWGIFPSVSAAWGISEEAFMKDINWVNDLKLRVGYGVTGNQTGLDPYRTLELYGMKGIYYNDGSWKTAYAISQNANPDLKWESTATMNLGLDFSLFNGRFGGSVELYKKKTSDMLYTYAVPTPPFVYDRMMANVGDMENTGVEMMFNIGVIRNKELDWTMTLNGSYNKNEITRLSNNHYETDKVYVGSPWIRGGSGVTSHIVETGRPVGQFYMWKCKGISDEGKYIFEDINHDGNIDDADRTYCGTALPDVIFGWQNTVNYKSWDFSVFFRGMIGNEVFNGPRAAYGNNTYLLGTNALNDELIYKLKGQNSQICSYYVEDASFIRLDNIALGYTFNTKKIDWLSKARIYVAAQNLFVITGYKGLDPEVQLGGRNETDRANSSRTSTGIMAGSGLYPGIEYRDFYPKSKTFTVGLNVTF